MVPVEPRTRRLWLLGERKLKGLKFRLPSLGSMTIESINMTILTAIIVVTN